MWYSSVLKNCCIERQSNDNCACTKHQKTNILWVQQYRMVLVVSQCDVTSWCHWRSRQTLHAAATPVISISCRNRYSTSLGCEYSLSIEHHVVVTCTKHFGWNNKTFDRFFNLSTMTEEKNVCKWTIKSNQIIYLPRKKIDRPKITMCLIVSSTQLTGCEDI